MRKLNVILFTFLVLVLLAINFLYNGYLLTLFYAFTYSLYHFSYTNKSVPHYANWFWSGLGFTTVILLIILGILEPIQSLTNSFTGSRTQIPLEEEKVRKLLDEIFVKLKQEMSGNLTNDSDKYLPNNNAQLLIKRQSDYIDILRLIKRIKIFVSDNRGINAEAFGRNNILVSKGLLDTLIEGEFKAVLVHEIAHLYYNDSLLLLALFWANAPMRCIMWLYQIYATWRLRVSKVFNSEGSLFSMVTIIPLILFSPIIIINYLGKWIMMAALFTFMRAFEYRADQFTLELGFKIELISFLNKQGQIRNNDNSFLGLVFASHPTPIKRIAKLERLNFK